jgi:hypothetical protein
VKRPQWSFSTKEICHSAKTVKERSPQQGASGKPIRFILPQRTLTWGQMIRILSWDRRQQKAMDLDRRWVLALINSLSCVTSSPWALFLPRPDEDDCNCTRSGRCCNIKWSDMLRHVKSWCIPDMQSLSALFFLSPLLLNPRPAVWQAKYPQTSLSSTANVER